MKSLKSNKGTYETIKYLDSTAGVCLGNYQYKLSDEIISGYCDYETRELLNNEFIPVIMIECNDGFVHATDYKGYTSKLFS